MSPIAFYRFFSAYSWLTFVMGLSLWSETSLFTLLMGLSLFSCICRYATARFYPEVKAAPLVPHLHLAARRRLLAARLAKLPHLARVAIFGAVATGVFLALPDVLRHTIMPTAGGFTPDNIGAAALGAFQFFAALSMAYVSWRYLFPGLYAYAAETMGGKLLESITTELSTRMERVHRHFDNPNASFNDLAHLVEATKLDFAEAAERRKIATLTFTIRCARFVFSVSPFVFFFVQANHALASALTVVPPAALGL
jgi:hypothetical protein